jgi:hypothetical protein
MAKRISTGVTKKTMINNPKVLSCVLFMVRIYMKLEFLSRYLFIKDFDVCYN